MMYQVAQIFKLSNVVLYFLPRENYDLLADMIMDALNYLLMFLMTDILFYQVIFKMREIKILQFSNIKTFSEFKPPLA